jgi:gamma-glutamylcysteine synthetase
VSRRALEQYLKHIDKFGLDMVTETASVDKDLDDQEREAVLRYVEAKQPPKKGKRKSESK